MRRMPYTHMCMYIYIYIYVCVCVYLDIHIYKYIYVYMCIVHNLPRVWCLVFGVRIQFAITVHVVGS